jgi:alpha-L-fucosidase
MKGKKLKLSVISFMKKEENNVLFYFFVFMSLCGLFFEKSYAQDKKIEAGKFQPSWESFEKDYKCPEWFRDAKFGIWAHWTAQCVPEQGDWYARGMYIQGDRYYDFHIKNYGHPSKFGFMELDNLWKAEKWDPEKLMALYKKAGAKYFVTLANHHDNFDNYNSKYHKWNSVNVGPKKDIVGIWEKLARKNGIKFGVSNHSAHAWHWFQTAYGYDGEGPLKGVRYDAATLTKEDGKGKWWEGLDPQELYTGPNMKIPDGIDGIEAVKDWHEKNDRVWTEEPPAQNPEFTENWFLRCKDLIDKYHPDLIYFDDYGLPLGQAGIDVTAHYYNSNTKWHNGKLEAVVTAKQLSQAQKSGVVEDIERGFSDDIQPLPWQTCSCIGDWHYKRSLYENNSYKTVGQIVCSLVDIVSKNGNLLLSIPMRADGTIDEHEIEFLEGMAKWMEINGEGIFETRPWKIFGEGPTQVKSGMFNENAVKNFTPEDIRFTVKGEFLYAFIMAWPGEKGILIKSLSNNSELISGEKVTSVKLLGSKEKIKWNQTEEGLKVSLPTNAPNENVSTLEIKFK